MSGMYGCDGPSKDDSSHRRVLSLLTGSALQAMDPSQQFWGPWWARRDWNTYLHDLLHYCSHRRYSLSISDGADHPLAATDPQAKLVLVNPTTLAYPEDKEHRRSIRHIPSSSLEFQQDIAVGAIEHESAHIRHSGEIPEAEILGWTWNATEDERIERLQIAEDPELDALFAFIGDAIWMTLAPTDDLLSACLIWRFEWDRPESERRFHPSSLVATQLWEEVIRPLVEEAWQASSSDEVTALASKILSELGIPEDAPLPDDLAESFCHCSGGQAGAGQASRTAPESGDEQSANGGEQEKLSAGSDPPRPPTRPVPPRGVRIPGQPRSQDSAGDGHNPGNPAQADPTALRAEVEPHAATLARMLRPARAYSARRAHQSRGDLSIERVIQGADRLFELPISPSAVPSEAWFNLVDVSDSMGEATVPGTTMWGARRATMWLVSGAERAGIAVGVGAFDDQPTMIKIRDLAVGPNHEADRRIAGLNHGNGTYLASALDNAASLLAAYPAKRKLLNVLIDGLLESEEDVSATQAVVAKLPKLRIQLLPLYLGKDPRVAQAVRMALGNILACPDLGGLLALYIAWMRAHQW